MSRPVAVIAIGASVVTAASLATVAAVGANVRQVARQVSADAVAFDKFGWAIALSGDTCVASAIEDDDHGAESGSAYVFERWTSGAKPWRETQKISPVDGAPDDFFGFAVGLSGDAAVISARGDDDNGVDAGSAYIFERDEGGAGNWGGVKKLFASDPAPGDFFGWSAALDGETAVVGSPFGSSNTGAAYVFERDQGGVGAWGFVKKLTSADASGLDRFGRSVSIDGDTIIVTADGNDDGGSSSGSAYVFARDVGGPSNWAQVKKLTASDASAVDHFGISCAVSGTTIVVGAHRDDDGGNESGSAYVFDRDEGGENNFGEVAKITASDAAAADSFGRAVAIRGDRIAVAAYAHEHGSFGARSGAVYLFGRNRGGADNWGQSQELIGWNQIAEDNFGWGLALGAEDVLVGAPHLDETVGFETGSLHAFAPRPPKTIQVTSFSRQPAPSSAPSVAGSVDGGGPRPILRRSPSGPSGSVSVELDCSGYAPGACWLFVFDRHGRALLREARTHASGIETFDLEIPELEGAGAFAFELRALILGPEQRAASNALAVTVGI